MAFTLSASSCKVQPGCLLLHNGFPQCPILGPWWVLCQAQVLCPTLQGLDLDRSSVHLLKPLGKNEQICPAVKSIPFKTNWEKQKIYYLHQMEASDPTPQTFRAPGRRQRGAFRPRDVQRQQVHGESRVARRVAKGQVCPWKRGWDQRKPREKLRTKRKS